MRFHVLRHVEANQFDPHGQGQLPGDLGLAHTRRSGEHEAADRLFFFAQSRPGHLDRSRQCIDRLVLAEHDQLQIAVQVAQGVAVGT